MVTVYFDTPSITGSFGALEEDASIWGEFIASLGAQRQQKPGWRVGEWMYKGEGYPSPLFC